MAALVHDCYQSLDLAFHLLTEHDRRTNRKIAADYLAGLKRAA
jgi:hypothetical protein